MSSTTRAEGDPKPSPGTLTLYYLATPLFAAVDLVLGEPVRVAALGAPEWRLAAGGAVDLGFGAAHVWNVAIVGAALVLSFKRSERELHAIFGFGTRGGTH